jgi:hypothetical protein
MGFGALPQAQIKNEATLPRGRVKRKVHLESQFRLEATEKMRPGSWSEASGSLVIQTLHPQFDPPEISSKCSK